MYYKGKIYSGEPWTAEENQKLKEMAKAQKPFYEIAESFKPKRTINAVFLHAREISRLDSGVRLFDDDGTKPKSDIFPTIMSNGQRKTTRTSYICLRKSR